MLKTLLPLAMLTTALVPLLQAMPAQAAGASRTFVAAQGSDSNPCTFGQPCRSFQAAYNVTAAGGEIDVLDPAGYGTLYITGPISIQGHGYAGISAPSGDAINISAGSNDRINLRGLLIDGVGTGAAGIQFGGGGSLNVQDCIIRNFASDGISFTPGGTSALFVSNTVVADNLAGSGIIVNPTGSGTVTAVISQVDADYNGYGIFAQSGPGGTLNVSVADSVVANSSSIGIFAATSVVLNAIMVRNSTISSNQIGIEAQGSQSIIRVGRSTITANGTGWQSVTSGTVDSYGDNNIDNNTLGNNAPDLISTK
jgi:hypothetical protein